MIYTIKLPDHLRRFPQGKIVVGGEARVAVDCLLHSKEWPATYIPRDFDYIRVADTDEADGTSGILWNEKSEDAEGKHVDSMVVSSLEDYFNQIDQHTNACAVTNNKLSITKEALFCFANKETRLNLEHPGLSKGGVAFWEYLALRACIQTGWDVRYCLQYRRHAACKLHSSIAKQLDYSSLKQNWYWSTYCHKMEQIKTGKH
jgi:hypothetical protein